MFEVDEAPILHPRVSLRVVASDLMEGGIVRKGEGEEELLTAVWNLWVVDLSDSTPMITPARSD